MKNAVAIHVLVVHGRALSQKELDHALVPLRWHTAVAQSGRRTAVAAAAPEGRERTSLISSQLNCLFKVPIYFGGVLLEVKAKALHLTPKKRIPSSKQ